MTSVMLFVRQPIRAGRFFQSLDLSSHTGPGYLFFLGQKSVHVASPPPIKSAVTEQDVPLIGLDLAQKALDICRSMSFWPMTFALACCAIEMMAVGMARFDIARFGTEVFRPSPRQSDLMIVAGTVTRKVAPVVIRLYEQMPAPRWFIAVGNCAVSGGPFKFKNQYPS